MYIKVIALGEQIFLLIYVNNVLFLSLSEALIADAKKLLSIYFNIIDKGPIKRYLGIDVICVYSKFYLS